jgi:hydroxylamine reductase
MNMFCYQCEQTSRGSGCTAQGVCGKTPEVAALQDLLIHLTKGVAQYAHRAHELGAADREVDLFVLEALFSTVTNVNFDAERVAALVRAAAGVRERARAAYVAAAREAGRPAATLSGPARFEPAAGMDALLAQAAEIGIARRIQGSSPEVIGLQELITYGLKGAAAYADHAQILGVTDPWVSGEFHRLLSLLAGDPQDVAQLTSAALEVGALNLRAMELLDRANTSTYGHPEPTEVRVTPRAGKCILVSGHDLADLAALLEQTSGKGILVYTHGEMLPALAYPGLKKHPHLAGNYGGAWQNQRAEFAEFPGAILMTTNCIQRPQDSYRDRLFTSGLVAWPGVRHIPSRDFAPVIAAALAAPGFPSDAPEQKITIGFARQAVMGVAGAVIDAVKRGAIRHFFLVGGCDGAKPGRDYYTRFAEAVPEDCVILTLACGKYRFNKLSFGAIGGIPRLLDVGQCNDAYSAVAIAKGLAEAFGCTVHDLPLSLILSWYEQKAVAVLLTLLHLGLRNIRIGPSLPAWITPPVWQVLQETFAIRAITTPQEDLAAILAGGPAAGRAPQPA